MFYINVRKKIPKVLLLCMTLTKPTQSYDFFFFLILYAVLLIPIAEPMVSFKNCQRAQT